MKKVLIITYHFPPDSAIGAVRPAKFAKYLPEFGWEPIIYTVKEKYCQACDYSRYEPALKHLKIYRANLIPGPLHLYSRFIYEPKGPLNALLRSQSNKGSGGNAVNPVKRFFSSMLRLPDDKQGWIANIALDCYRILRKHKIDAFITSGPPMSTHVGGLLLRSMTHAKWVADFRDPWTKSSWKSNYMRTVCSDAMEKWLEAKIIRKANLIVSTTSSITNYFRLVLPEQTENKCITITNGFDDEDFIEIGKSILKVNSKIRISHTGTLYLKRDPEPFLAALNELLTKGMIDQRRFEVDLIGNCSYYKDVSVQELIDKYGLSSLVRLVGMMPFNESLEWLMSSDALLLFAQGQPDQIPGKVFEYVKINKPIFAITEEGETRRILEGFENAIIANPLKTNDIAEKFLQMLEAIENGRRYLCCSEKVREYDRRTLTERLAKYLDALA